MIRFPNKKIAGLSLSGHASLTSKGQDILCAAVSVLVENLGHSLRTILGLSLKRETGKGLYTAVIDPEDVSEKSELLFASALLGLEVLAGQYPDRLEFKEELYGA